MPHAFNINLFCRIASKYPKYWCTIRRELLLLKRSNFGYFDANYGGVCHTDFSDKTGLYNSLYYLNNTKCRCVPHYFIDNSNYENVKLDFNARYVE